MTGYSHPSAPSRRSRPEHVCGDPMSVETSIPDTSLGLTSSEIQILRQQQQIALQGSNSGNVSRGRGSVVNSNSSSRATSAASTQGRLLLDPTSLRALSHQLDYLQEQIRSRIEHVCDHLFFFFFFVRCPPLCIPVSPQHRGERSCSSPLPSAINLFHPWLVSWFSRYPLM